MNRSTKHSSGFYDTPICTEMKNSKPNKFLPNGVTTSSGIGESSSASDDSWNQQKGRKIYHTPPTPPRRNQARVVEEEIETVTIPDSDDEEDISFDNNNEEASPDRHCAGEFDLRDSNESERHEESDDDDVIAITDFSDEMERFSEIHSTGKSSLAAAGR